MMVFKKIFTLEMKLFMKKYYLIIPMFLSFLYMFYGYYIMKDALDNFSFLRTSGFVMMFLTILSICFGVINARQDKDAKFEEVLNTLPAAWTRLMAKVFTWAVCSFAYCLILAIFCTVWVDNGLKELGKYGLQVVPYIFVNFYMPMISTWLIAYSVEKTFNPKIGWPVLLLIWYIISPIKNRTSGISFMLNQFVEDPYGDSRLLHYGLELNIGLLSRKLWFLMFGMSIYVLVNLISLGTRNLKNAKAKIAGAAAILLFISAVPLAVFSSKPHSLGQMWEISHSVWNDEILEQAKERLESEYCNGEIKLLHLELGDSKGDLLEYYAKINIDNVRKEPVIFTLYRSLAVKNVKVNGSEYNEFIRDGDWIVIQEPLKGELEIEINVSGKLPYLLGEITDHTLLLMPDFPWYPVLGKHKVMLPVLTHGYLPNNLSNGEPYDIVLKSHRGDVITNLSYDMDTEFSGQVTGPLVIQGDYKSGNIGGIHFVAPPSIYHFYKEYIGIIPDLFMEYRKEFENSLGIETDYNFCDKYNKVFLVNLNESIRINHDEVYLDYSSWVHLASEDSIRRSCEFLRPMLAFECFWRTGEFVESSVAPCLFQTLIEIAETGEKKDLEEYYSQWWDEDREKQIVWENDLSDVYEIERLIKAESKEEISKIAYEILRKWVTVNKSK
ncbi:ABC-2 family transporter permease [Acetivibrio mesophilus]|uniref:ABC-type transport system involved in multi-copper enzyme maturation, permease component n=1 Tax=Acetivibrio mesophilus TaxID=2487273 RepID=A0A4Q0I467_9FIRM|nr:hypothetical protein [Acetivibrio mesophilus]RXE58505.1 hypothetical protein EFD62_12025 [Acetivibrio mesophilus]